MASRGKFQRLVDDFVATVDEQGGRIDPAVVAAELQSRIDAVALQLGITQQTVLRSYFDDDWGRQMATTMMAEVRSRDADEPVGPGEQLPIRAAARLLAGLGQAILFATINDDLRASAPRLDPEAAAHAVTGLSMAIYDRTSDTEPVAVNGQVVAWTRTTLQTLRDQLRAAAWTSCSCGDREGHAEVDAGVLHAVTADLLLLPLAPPATPGRSTPDTRPASQVGEDGPTGLGEQPPGGSRGRIAQLHQP